MELASYETLTLRLFGPEHLPLVGQMMSSGITRDHWRTRGRIIPPDQLLSFLSRSTFLSAIGMAQQDGREGPVALVELLDMDFQDKRAQLSLVAAPDQMGTGLPILTALLFCNYVFRTYEIEKLQIETQAQNGRLVPGLHRVLDHEGTLRRQINLHGRWLDIEVFALWRSDLDRLNKMFGVDSEKVVYPVA